MQTGKSFYRYSLPLMSGVFFLIVIICVNIYGASATSGIHATPHIPVVNGIMNGDFRYGDTVEEAGWSWWSIDDLGHVSFSTEAHVGRRSLKIVREADEPYSNHEDWILMNDRRLEVNEGEVWTASVRVKYENTDRMALNIRELDKNGYPLINYSPGSGGGTHEAYGTGGFYYGQGAHHLFTVDLDGDGRDEIILGSAVIDDNGEGLWSTGMGHPDNMFVGNLDPSRPGMEIYYGLEIDQVRYGMNMVDARTGAMIWGINQPTEHIHNTGLVSNIDSSYTGMEIFGGERHHDDRWLFSSRGELLAREDEIPWDRLGPGAVYWDATTQREVIDGSRIFRYPDNSTVFDGVEGRHVAWFDFWGDWREEIITSVPGELRIYTTPIPARDRRVTFLQDPLYRSTVAHKAMGYGRIPPLTRYFVE